MNGLRFQVHLVDDDQRILAALSRLLAIAGYEVRTFVDAEAYLNEHDPDVPSCAVIDLGLPGKDGFELQRELEKCGRPVIFLTGRGNIPTSVRAMKAGALDFLEKPIDADVLLLAIAHAKHIDESRRLESHDRKSFGERFDRLTPRERQVLDQVVAGRMNKQIAGNLGTAEKTVKIHRGRMMEKMGVRTLAELVKLVHVHGASGRSSGAGQSHHPH